MLTKRNRNTFVTLITPEKVEEIYTVRLALEPVAAAAIARGDTVAMVNADLAFHESVWKFSGNEYLERSPGLVCPPFFAFYLVNFSSSDRLPADLLADANEHTELIQALETGDPARAKPLRRRCKCSAGAIYSTWHP